jgi:hypothetical protein
MLRNLKLAAVILAMTITTGGVALAQEGHRDYDHDRDDYGYNYGYGRDRGRIAWDTGYQDGARVAREDFAHRKPYDPYPRGKYAREDHGYRREYGDRYAYMNQYARAYQQGYARAFRRY